MYKEKLVIVGMGEVGRSLYNVLKEHYEILTHDFLGNPVPDVPIDILHIAFPYSNVFIGEIKKYQKAYNPKFTLVHSTVPIGTCRQVNAVHSFVTGKHPNLEEGIKTFTKYFGGKNAYECADIFSRIGIRTTCYSDPEITESMKLISTTYYGLNIMIEKEIYFWCQKNNLSFELIYSENNKDYNEGYGKMGCPQFIRPNLKHIKGGIGGHCIVNNLDLLKDFWLADLLKQKNEEYKKEQ